MAHVSMTHGYSIIVNHGLHVIRLRVTMWYDYIYIYTWSMAANTRGMTMIMHENS